ncbi:MAG: HD domain-containing protein [Desulfobacterales bacterium]|nr:HD domain-containing protein [Desulfobacterales bacterium]MDJ0854258.1 HD domain-containing protein [Desulfobacterales bacterium]MDJ0991082.1 HD domain-containing protein [Desulfobacterales bacterium]
MTAKEPAARRMPAPARETVDAEAILREVFGAGTRRFDIIRRHGEQVAARALNIAAGLKPASIDESFLYAAAMLHDIGIVKTATPQLDCHGDQPYIRHGIIGRQILEAHGLPRHALVCERHVGVGITTADIRHSKLPLPLRDMRPVTIEEELICYADKFFSKTNGQVEKPKSAPEVAHHLKTYGRRQAETFIRWAARFEGLILNHNDDWYEGRHNQNKRRV